MREVIAGRTRLVELLVPCLEAAVARGVDVQAIVDAAALLKQAGVQIAYREACPNLVVVDSAIV